MIDVNKITNKLLSPLRKEGIRVCYQYPESFEKLPAVSYYDLLTSECFKADNTEVSQLSRVQIDIWSERGSTGRNSRADRLKSKRKRQHKTIGIKSR